MLPHFVKLNYYSSQSLSTQLKAKNIAFNEAKIKSYEVSVKQLLSLFEAQFLTVSEFNRATDRIDKLVKINLKYNNKL